MKIPQQPSLLLNKPNEASPEEFLHWQETELKWWADKQMNIVAIMSVVQVTMFGLMLLCFHIISLEF